MMLFVNLDDVPQVLELMERERSPGLPAIMLVGLAAGYLLGRSDLKTCKMLALGLVRRELRVGLCHCAG
jgi:hypothetical protein